jgi:hypothetical protein
MKHLTGFRFCTFTHSIPKIKAPTDPQTSLHLFGCDARDQGEQSVGFPETESVLKVEASSFLEAVKKCPQFADKPQLA